MSPRLKIYKNVIKRLEKLQNDCVGNLYGIRVDNSILIVSIALRAEPNASDGKQSSKIIGHDIISNLPAGISYYGVFVAKNNHKLKDFNEKLLEETEEFPVVINVDTESKKISAGFFKDSKVEEAEYTEMDEVEFKKQFLHLRLTAALPFNCDTDPSCVKLKFNEIEKMILNGRTAFQIVETNTNILGSKPEQISGFSPKTELSELIIKANNEKKKNLIRMDILNVEMMIRCTLSDNKPGQAPLIKYVKKQFRHVETELILDTLIVAPRTLQLVHLYQMLNEGVLRNFTLQKVSLLRELQGEKRESAFEEPKTCHFLPSDLGHFVTVVYPMGKLSDDLVKVREALHTSFALSLDKPLFRESMAYDFNRGSQTENQNLLLNTHESVGPSGVPDGEACFVHGTYAYHHYMQDGFDDSGWGCAYRSLQTVFSWFRYQGYTTMPVPSHKDIQECLVSIGDKPQSFVGSSQWIGSTEVSFVLDTMLGISCRIVSVSSGEEMTTKGGELSHHFKTQGTPVMIGGGVLAHTIIGVDYNRRTGAIKFLILDPHYTGKEDLGVILKKGWCGWKGPEFWKKDSFYNMCMPLKPKGV